MSEAVEPSTVTALTWYPELAEIEKDWLFPCPTGIDPEGVIVPPVPAEEVMV